MLRNLIKTRLLVTDINKCNVLLFEMKELSTYDISNVRGMIIKRLDLLPGVIEANLGVALGVTVAHRLPLTRHFHNT